MIQPSSTATVSVPSEGLFAVALTEPVYTPETRAWAADAAQTSDIAPSTLVGMYTSGPNAGKAGVYDNSASNGLETAIGVLGNVIPANATANNDATVTVYTAGKFKTTGLTGFDAAAEADLGASTSNGVVSF